MNTDFWKGKRVLVTGHTGFKGGWLSAWLTLAGADVFGYALDIPTIPSFFVDYNLRDKIYHQIGNIIDTKLFTYVDNVKPSVIFHLAAQPIVRRSYNIPFSTFETNIMGTINLLQAAMNQDVRAIVVVTSDKCYLPDILPHTECDSLGGYDPYSASKACQEIVTQAYTESFFKSTNCAVATVRAGNVIGGGDWAEDRLVPDIFRAINADKLVKLRYPDAKRPWQHVLEPLHGYIMLAEKLVNEGQNWSGAWNFGPNYLTDVGLTVGELTTALGGKNSWIYEKSEIELKEDFSLFLDCTKANQFLGWYPKFSLEEMCKLTIDWYDSHYAGENVEGLTNAQIISYMEKA